MKRFFLSVLTALLAVGAWADGQQVVKAVRLLNQQTVEVVYADGRSMTIDFYGPNIFRLFRDDQGGLIRDPQATPPAEILVSNARRKLSQPLQMSDEATSFLVQSKAASGDGVIISINKSTGLLSIGRVGRSEPVVEQTSPLEFKNGGYDLHLSMKPDEYYFGGGVQNGRFSHRGERIDIVNTNSWTDGGVCSPAPFYWSTAGYGVLCHTFRPGHYDFSGQETLIHHDADYLDVFFFTGNEPVDLLNCYYQLTGHPVLLPKFAFYEGHLNAYNRDYWTPTDDEQRGVLFEDGRRYVESQKPVDGGIRESLNGSECSDDIVTDATTAYQFSARAVIDRYAAHDMPLGWILPNDGYGTGYGQAATLDGNIQNLKSFGDYAHSKGVEIGLWTQSNLHPVDSIPALLQRDIIKEVRDAGVRVLKTDVAWVGAGYSFGLNGIADVAQIMPYYGHQARPFIISVDGWAGTQRYAGIWTGDQTGGEWEYIRFHIPTYIGSGLAGQPNITSDMDGIFGGRNMEVNIRDFQWKTFTPMQLNMDGWGSHAKYPHTLGEPAASINRSYLKWKSMLLPYTYTFAHEAIKGKPLIRAMFLSLDDGLKTKEEGMKNEGAVDNRYQVKDAGFLKKNAKASPKDVSPELRRFLYGKRTQYQFMYGPSFLVAPIYEPGTLRNNIYLPEGTWYDYFTGQSYAGGCILNSFECPLWKLPVFVRKGAIIPMNNPNNNPSQIDSTLITYEVYPSRMPSDIVVYDDDGTTDNYLYNRGDHHTWVMQHVSDYDLKLSVYSPQRGQRQRFVVNVAKKPKKVTVRVDGKRVDVATEFVESPELNRFSTPGSEMAGFSVRKNPQFIIEVPAVDRDKAKIEILVRDIVMLPEPTNTNLKTTNRLAMQQPATDDCEATAYALTPTWKAVEGADYYELMFEGMRYTNIRDTHYTVDLLKPETDYQFSVRAVSKGETGPWTDFTLRTAANPLEFAMHGLTATCTAAEQPGSGIQYLFDFDDRGDIWHTDWQNSQAVPFTIDVDMHALTEVDHITYLPRDNAGNGNILAGTMQLSADGRTWSEPQNFRWQRDNKPKDIFPTITSEGGEAQVRYVRLNVTDAVGGFGSGTELYVFRRPDAKVIIPGDINQDGHIDEGDLTSYLNYTGLRQGDGDFDGYVSVGDVNRNGYIDAQDISNVATLLGTSAAVATGQGVAGSVVIEPDRKSYKAGDEIVINVTGIGLQAVNALNLVVPYNQRDMQFESVEPLAVGQMQNMTNDRLHSNGDRVLYPTFVNIGRQPLLHGDQPLFRLHFKALRAINWDKQRLVYSGLLVDPQLGAKEVNE